MVGHRDMRTKPYPENIAMAVERERGSEGQRAHGSSRLDFFGSAISNIAHAIFPLQSNAQNSSHGNTWPSGIGPSKADVISTDKPPGAQHSLDGSVDLNPVRKQVSPNVQSIRYVPDKTPNQGDTVGVQADLGTHDGEGNQTVPNSLGEEALPSMEQKIRDQEIAQRKDKRIIQLEGVVYNLRNSNMELQRKNNAQYDGILARNNEIHIRNENIRRLDEKLAKKSEVLDKFRDEQQKQEEQVRLAQQGSFRHLEQGKWAPREDSTIRSELAKFFGELRSWAKRFSSSDLSNLEKASVESQGNLIAALDESVDQNDLTHSGWINAEKMKDKSPFLLVQAMLAAYISKRIFEDPFFFLDDGEASLAGSMLNYGQVGFGSNLNALYLDMKKVDVSQAHAWRSETLRLLSTPSHHNRDGNTPEPIFSLKNHIAEMRERMCEVFAIDFISGPVQLLSRQGNTQEEIEKLSSGLFHLFSSAGEISIRLWTQRTNIEFGNLYGLRTFSVDSEVMTAHRLHKLDDDDHRLDGKRIVAVIQPAIGASGDNEGQNYDQFKTWSKAVVLIDDFEEDDDISLMDAADP